MSGGVEFAAAAFGAVLSFFLQTATTILKQPSKKDSIGKIAVLPNKSENSLKDGVQRTIEDGVDDGFQKLQRTIKQLEDYVNNHLENHGAAVNNDYFKMWLQRVVSVIYDADDLLDEVWLEVSRGDNGDSDRIEKAVKELNISKEIKDLNGRIEEFIKEAGTHKAIPEWDPLESWLVDESAVVGRADQKGKMIDWVLAEETEVSVIAIVGMGGIGKTTLARIVFNDGRVTERFSLRMWVAMVSISSTSDVISATKKILQSVIGESGIISDDLPVLQVKLQELIRGKRFLLVLDGLRSVKHEYWDLLFLSLGVRCRGSKIVVTTSSKKLASIVRTGPSYFLEGLSDDCCWELMKKEAFRNRHMRDVELEVIGKNIAKKCTGLPFVAKELGKMLNFKAIVEWNSIQERELLDMTEGKNAILRSLGPSYFDLPAYLKNCLGYCSLFSRDFEFQADEMVLLWMAEGFIKPADNQRLEDIGIEYFRELVWNGFFQSSHNDLDVDGDDQRVYRLHHLIHDMLRLVSSDTYTRIREENGLPNNEFNVYPRHLALEGENIGEIMSHLPDWCKKLRTFSVECDRSSRGASLSELFKKLKSARVLILRNSGISQLCDSIRYLKHLRYLKLCEPNITKLPEEITELCALQTLKLEKCRSLRKLPKSFNKLTSLEHLDLGGSQLTHMPQDLGRLSNLQTLSEFIVGKNNRLRQTVSECSGRNGRYGIGQLKNMQCLRGSLCIRNLDNVHSAKDAKKAMLDNKPHLRKLQLEWKKFDPIWSQRRADKKILASLKPHRNLRGLVIKNYRGQSFPNWLGDPVFQLTSITLDTCPNCSDFPFKSLGRLPLLNCLRVYSLPNLVKLDGEFLERGDGVAPFQRLEVLEFKDMTRLKKWTEELTEGDLPHLQQLIFENCPILSVLPSLLNLEELKLLRIPLCPQLTTLPQRRGSVNLSRVSRNQDSQER